MSAKFVVFKNHTFDVQNEVYFAYNFDELLDTLDRLAKEQPDVEWGFADIIGRDGFFFRFLKLVVGWIKD